MEGPYLPEESEGEEPSAYTPVELEERALQQYEAKMRSFEDGLFYLSARRKRRRTFGDYRKKNVEEAWASRLGEGGKARDGLG